VGDCGRGQLGKMNSTPWTELGGGAPTASGGGPRARTHRGLGKRTAAHSHARGAAARTWHVGPRPRRLGERRGAGRVGARVGG
jgi:hypothetical protein